MKRQDDGTTVLFFCSAIGGIALLLVAFLVPWPVGPEFWLKDKSGVEAIGLVFTPVGILGGVIGLFLNGRSSNQTLRQSQQTEAATRFQKACEMLSSKDPAISVGGTTLLKTIAIQYPSEYWPAVLQVLEAFSSSCDAEVKKRYWTGNNDDRIDPDQLLPPDPRADIAFEAIGQLHELLAWPADVLFAGRYVIGSVYDANAETAKWRLWDTECPQWIVHNSSVAGGDIRRSIITFAVGSGVKLVNLDARNSEITIEDLSGLTSFSDGCHTDHFSIEGGLWDGATVNGHSIEKWRENCRRIVEQRGEV